MTETVTLVCRVDSLNDKSYIDRQVATVLRSYKAHLKGRRSNLTLTSEIERKYNFHELSADDAISLKSIATENKSRLCVKRIEIGSETLAAPPTPPPPPPPSPTLVVPSPTVSVSSISSNTRSLVLNFGVDDDNSTTSSGSGNNSFFSSDSETSGSIGVGTQVATPEILLLRELADIMGTESVKPTPSQIGKAVSTWFVGENVQKVMRRIV
ncbi:EsV-1-37 [Ectocarpus siliculosus virus 1]|uniref:EsV-1-37 n=1 Tax=Ectocarpus siliculosus virus 1 (isolate New Zealand/Kaikoura/1988) TaxID=654926 RepID=Q8QNM7_ESV1K|nr:EsV-1-37 [Ectocarpus siliculosus virus 1]AAK14463.1 EsV-1-37 [Ectocarpus siliculosus virus 1]